MELCNFLGAMHSPLPLQAVGEEHFSGCLECPLFLRSSVLVTSSKARSP